MLTPSHVFGWSSEGRRSEKQDIKYAYNNFIYHAVSNMFRPIRPSSGCLQKLQESLHSICN